MQCNPILIKHSKVSIKLLIKILTKTPQEEVEQVTPHHEIQDQDDHAHDNTSLIIL